MANIKINQLSTDNKSAEMQQLSGENAKKVIGGIAFAAVPVVVQASCCPTCCGQLLLA